MAKETNAQFIDFFFSMFSLNDYQNKLKGIKNDGLHFGEEGYDILADLIVKKVRDVYMAC